jgi:hypothetical protein
LGPLCFFRLIVSGGQYASLCKVHNVNRRI